MTSTNPHKKESVHPSSDGSELIPAEVQANIRNADDSPSLNKPLGGGYRVDDEGIIDNYALEPEMSKAEYPSQNQQRRYIYLGVAAMLIVVLAVWIAVGVS